MTNSERELLLFMARSWLREQTEAGASLGVDIKTHPGLRKARELIAAVEQEGSQ